MTQLHLPITEWESEPCVDCGLTYALDTRIYTHRQSWLTITTYEDVLLCGRCIVRRREEADKAYDEMLREMGEDPDFDGTIPDE